MSKIFKIVGIGEIVLDLYPDDKFVGGVPANVARHVHQLGHAGIIASRIGQDPAGEFLLKQLQLQNMTSHLIQIDNSHPTATVKINLNEYGNPQYICNNDAAFEYLEYSEALSKSASSFDAVIFSALGQRNSISHASIHAFLSDAAQAFKAFDMNIHQPYSGRTELIVKKSLQITDAIKFNEFEFNLLKRAFRSEKSTDKAFIASLSDEFSLKIAALTKGKKGCLVYSAREFIEVPAVKITPVDTTGVGDAFLAAMVIKYLEGYNLPEIAEAANRLSAFVAKHKGAVPAYYGWPAMRDSQ